MRARLGLEPRDLEAVGGQDFAHVVDVLDLVAQPAHLVLVVLHPLGLEILRVRERADARV